MPSRDRSGSQKNQGPQETLGPRRFDFYGVGSPEQLLASPPSAIRNGHSSSTLGSPGAFDSLCLICLAISSSVRSYRVLRRFFNAACFTDSLEVALAASKLVILPSGFSSLSRWPSPEITRFFLSK